MSTNNNRFFTHRSARKIKKREKEILCYFWNFFDSTENVREIKNNSWKIWDSQSIADNLHVFWDFKTYGAR